MSLKKFLQQKGFIEKEEEPEKKKSKKKPTVRKTGSAANDRANILSYLWH